MEVMDYYHIRDEVIPQGNVEELEKFLTSESFDVCDIASLLGSALYYENQNMIAAINLKVRQKEINLAERDVLEGAYNARCRETGKRNPDCCISYCDFDDTLYQKYKERYPRIFNRRTPSN